MIGRAQVRRSTWKKRIDRIPDSRTSDAFERLPARYKRLPHKVVGTQKSKSALKSQQLGHNSLTMLKRVMLTGNSPAKVTMKLDCSIRQSVVKIVFEIWVIVVT